MDRGGVGMRYEMAVASKDVIEALKKESVGMHNEWGFASFYGIGLFESSFYPFDLEDGTRILGMITDGTGWTPLVDRSNKRVPFTTA